MLKVEVRNRILGTQPDPSNIVLELLQETLTARELICQTVAEQVHDLLTIQRYSMSEARQILNRRYLTEDEVQQQAQRGAIRLPSEQKPLQIDAAEQAEKAVAAFKQGVYVLYVDGKQVEELDEVIYLTATSKVTFLRLTPLVGG